MKQTPNKEFWNKVVCEPRYYKHFIELVKQDNFMNGMEVIADCWCDENMAYAISDTGEFTTIIIKPEAADTDGGIDGDD